MLLVFQLHLLYISMSGFHSEDGGILTSWTFPYSDSFQARLTSIHSWAEQSDRGWARHCFLTRLSQTFVVRIWFFSSWGNVGVSETCSEETSQTYHVYDLLQGQAECENHSLGLIGHRSLQLVVVGQQVLQQHPLVQAAVGSWNSQTLSDWISSDHRDWVDEGD